MSVSTPRVFRATLEAWLGQLLLPLAFFVTLSITAVRHAGLDPLIAGLGLGVLVIVAVLDYLLPMARNWFLADDCTLGGSLNGHRFQIYWNEILAAWVAILRGKRYLCLGTREGTIVLPLRFFNGQAVWATVRERVPAGALKESALLRLPDYQRWVQARAAVPQDGVIPDAEYQACPVTDHWLIQLVGWAGLAACLLGLSGAIGSGNLLAGLLCFGLTILAVDILRGWGITEIDGRGVRRNTLFGGWELAWEDVREIEMDPWRLVLVLVSKGGLRIIPGPWLWNGLKKEMAIALMIDQAGRRQIPLRRSKNAWSRIVGWHRLAR